MNRTDHPATGNLRWNARNWWAPLPNEQVPLHKEMNKTWNASDSKAKERLAKGQDRLFRATRNKELARDPIPEDGVREEEVLIGA